MSVAAPHIERRLRQVNGGVEARFGGPQERPKGGQITQVAGKQVGCHAAGSKAGCMLVAQQAFQNLFVTRSHRVWRKMAGQFSARSAVVLRIG